MILTSGKLIGTVQNCVMSPMLRLIRMALLRGGCYPGSRMRRIVQLNVISHGVHAEALRAFGEAAAAHPCRGCKPVFIWQDA